MKRKDLTLAMLWAEFGLGRKMVWPQWEDFPGFVFIQCDVDLYVCIPATRAHAPRHHQGSRYTWKISRIRQNPAPCFPDKAMLRSPFEKPYSMFPHAKPFHPHCLIPPLCAL